MRNLLVLLTAIVILIPAQVLAGGPPRSKLESIRNKNVVVIVAEMTDEKGNPNPAACNGVISRGTIFTAAHCCIDESNPFQPSAIAYSWDGTEFYPISKIEPDTQGTDICRLYPAKKLSGGLAITKVGTGNKPTFYFKKNAWIVTKVNLFRPGKEFEELSVQPAYRIGAWEEDSALAAYYARAVEGMSGGPILDNSGNLIGIVSAIPENDDKKPVYGVTLVNMFFDSMWWTGKK